MFNFQVPIVALTAHKSDETASQSAATRMDRTVLPFLLVSSLVCWDDPNAEEGSKR